MVIRRTIVICTAVLTLALSATEFQAARFAAGTVPLPPPRTLGPLQVVVHLTVSETGSVEDVKMLHATEPLAGLLQAHLERWRFVPAHHAGTPVRTTVLVSGIYRPASLFDPPGTSQQPDLVTQHATHAPVPVFTQSPAYPPQNLGDAVVLIEVRVDASGKVDAANVIRSSGTAFDSSAIQAARRWVFSSATPEARPTFAYLIFGFRQPTVVR